MVLVGDHDSNHSTDILSSLSLRPSRQQQQERADGGSSDWPDSYENVHASDDDDQWHAVARNTASASTTATPKTQRRSWQRRILAMSLLIIVLGCIAMAVAFHVERKEQVPLRVDPNAMEFTTAQLATHNTPNDCYMGLHGKVYDVTTWAPQHPGGSDNILAECGTEATLTFGSFHAPDVLALLDAQGLQVGVTPEATSSPTVPRPTAAPRPTQQPTVTAAPNVSPPPTAIPTITAAPTALQLCSVQYYTTAQVESHASRDDCWYVLYGVVYDWTQYAEIHPGNARTVWTFCGVATIDATLGYARYPLHTEELLLVNFTQYVVGKYGGEDVSETRIEACPDTWKNELLAANV